MPYDSSRVENIVRERNMMSKKMWPECDGGFCLARRWACFVVGLVFMWGCGGVNSDPALLDALKKGRAIAAATEVGVNADDLRSRVQDFSIAISEVQDESKRQRLKEAVELYKDSITLMGALTQPKIYMFQIGGTKSDDVAVRKNGEPPARADEAAAYIPLFEVTSRRHAVLAVEQDADRWVISKAKGVQQLWAAADKILQGVQ